MRNYSVRFSIILVASLFLTINVFARIPLLNNPKNANESARSATLYMYSQIGKDVPLQGNINQLNKFLDELKNSKTKKIRIGHFGDSIIWGDVITEEIRKLLQAKYGGAGLGFISICNDDLMVRQNIDHEFSDDWDWGSVFTKNTKRYPLGLNGISSTPGSNSWVSYKVNDPDYDFNVMTILYRDTKSNSKVVIESDEGTQEVSLPSSGKGLEEFTHNFNSRQSGVKLTFKNCEGSYIYGVNLEDGNGIYVDNFAMRGNSGISLKSLDTDLLKDASADLNYRLFIFNFGINVVEAGKTDHTFYKKMMSRIIKSYSKKFPNAAFIVMSAGDRAIKKGPRLVSDEVVPTLVEAQEEFSNDAGVAFWNLYEAMGGDGSMVEWVENGLANKDYIHLNHDGGKVVAEKFIKALLGEN